MLKTESLVSYHHDGVPPGSVSTSTGPDSGSSSTASTGSGMSAAVSPISESSSVATEVTDEASSPSTRVDASSNSPAAGEESPEYASIAQAAENASRATMNHGTHNGGVSESLLVGQNGSLLPGHLVQSAVTDRQATERPTTSDGGDLITITCGGLAAKLHLSRFLCPGIHQVCVELNGEFITPKQLTVIAAKDKQKDWKGAIKINRQPLRVLFEKQSLDFYRHAEFCSGRCVSKNRWGAPGQSETGSTDTPTSMSAGGGGGGGPLPADFKMEIPPSFFHLLPSLVPLSPQPTLMSSLEAQQQMFSAFQFTARQLQQQALAAAAAAHQIPPQAIKDEPTTAEPDSSNNLVMGDRSASTLPIYGNGGAHVNQYLLNMDAEFDFRKPFQYWNCVEKVGLFPELINEILAEIRLLESTFTNRNELKPFAAKKLSELVRVLDIKDRIDQRLLTKRCLAKAQTALLSSEIEELKRRTIEHKRKQLEIKRRSEIFDQLIGIKEPRLSEPSLQHVSNSSDSDVDN